MLFIFISHGHAQWQNRSEANLKGSVRSVKLNHLKFMTEGDSIWGEKAPDNDPFWFKGYVDESYLFDRDGKTTEYHAYFTDDADDNKTQNIYDKEGKLREQRYFADRRKRGRILYDYDDEGRIILVTRYDEKDDITDLIFHLRTPHSALPLHRSKNNIWTYKYNDKGECIEEKCLFPNGKTNFRHLYFYDDRGRQIQIITFDGKNRQQSTQSYKYNKQGLISSIRYVSEIKSKISNYWFDAEGNEVRSQITEVDLQKLNPVLTKMEEETVRKRNLKEYHSVTETTNKYIYDDNGNWIERYFYVQDVPQFVQVRQIDYW